MMIKRPFQKVVSFLIDQTLAGKIQFHLPQMHALQVTKETELKAENEILYI